MTDTTPCAYCVALPEDRRGRATRLLRCPLCKTELGAAASGEKFRVAAADPGEPRSRLGRLVALVSAGALTGCLLIFVPVVLHGRGPRMPSDDIAVEAVR